MSSFWESKYNNSEKSIQFIQQAHAEVLKGLHNEIETLQKQCADYALRLSLQASTSVEKEEYDKKFKTYNTEYKKKDALIVEQKKLIDERNKSIKSLEERVKTLEKKLETEINARDNLIKQFRIQTEQQSQQIANLTYQLHNLSKLKSINQTTESIEPDKKLSTSSTSSSSNSKLSKPIKNNPKNSLKEEEHAFVNSKLTTKSKISSERKSSADSHDVLNLNDFKEESLTQFKNSVSSINSNSPRSERSLTPPITKVLPPVVKRVSDIVPPPDPKPFLLSAASTLHTRSKKDLIQRKALISLPPIKPYELNQLAVESPIKIGHKNSSLLPGQTTTHDQNNNTTN